ncbi:MAG: protein translocase subunit SecF [Pseudomonadota bacterium]
MKRSFSFNFDFLRWVRQAAIVSGIAILLSIGLIATRGLNFGLDFTGGFLIEVGYEQPADLDVLRGALAGGGFEDAQVQHFGSATEVLVRLAPPEEEGAADISSDVLTALERAGGDPTMKRVEFVGPQIGDELRDQGGLAVIYALAGILVYVWLRFEWKFAAGSIFALVHDVCIVVGACALFQIDFDLSVLAAVLAVVGYSLNDTIVVFDRIRENFRRRGAGGTTEVMNLSINQTLTRTIITSGTTLLALISLFLFGGEVLRGFSFALIVGVLVGTYSSIYVASGSALLLGLQREDLLPVEKEGVDVDTTP